MFQAIKTTILKSIWPFGSEAKIRKGPLQGYKFIISKNSGWSPILGRWEPESQALFSAVIKPGHTVYDLGANNGIHSMLFAVMAGKTGKVFSFEPLETNCNEIKRNATLNEIENIEVVQAAVSNEPGQTVFHLGLHDKQGSLVGIGRESGNDIAVRLESLDEFIGKGNPAPDFIKIDIEGAESLALEGFDKRIDTVKPAFFIELHTPEQDGKVGTFLLKHGYKAYRLTEDSKNQSLGFNGLEEIKDFTKVFPHPDGIWGSILTFHPANPVRFS